MPINAGCFFGFFITQAFYRFFIKIINYRFWVFATNWNDYFFYDERGIKKAHVEVGIILKIISNDRRPLPSDIPRRRRPG